MDKFAATKTRAKAKKKGKKDTSNDTTSETNEGDTKDSTGRSAFCAYKWANTADSFLKAINTHVDDEAMKIIIELAQASRVDGHEERSASSSEVSHSFVDELVEGSDASASSPEDNDPLSVCIPLLGISLFKV